MNMRKTQMSVAPTREEADAPPEQNNAKTPTISIVAALRAFSVMAGPSALFNLFLVASMVTNISIALTWPPIGLGRYLWPLGALGAILAVLYPAMIRPWMLRWGATDEERGKALPGDDLVPHPLTMSTRAITVHAPVQAVWPWLAQIGQDRGGFYSYEWLENLAGCQMHNADHIHPEWQQRAVGDIVKLHWAIGNKVVWFEPNQALVLEGWGAFVVEPLSHQRTRVLLRSRTKRGWPALYETGISRG